MPKKGGLLRTFRGFYQGRSCGSDQSVVVFQKGDFDFENGDFLSSIRTGLSENHANSGNDRPGQYQGSMEEGGRRS